MELEKENIMSFFPKECMDACMNAFSCEKILVYLVIYFNNVRTFYLQAFI